MPRVRMRTTNSRSYSEGQLKHAVKIVLEGGFSVKRASECSGIPRITLKRYVDKCRVEDINSINFRPKNEHLSVFTGEEELMLRDYILKACNIHHGLSSKQVRILAYEFADANNKRTPENWTQHNMAGKEWLFAFRKRHNLSLRTPEQTSLSRATSFNKTNVDIFFKNLGEVKVKYQFQARDIYNLDETATTTVHKPPKILTTKGKKGVGKVTSAERGTLVTVVGIIGATGKYVPPFIIFPRVNFKENMLQGAPPGSKGVAAPSGWMNSSLFLPLLQHFVEHERPTKDHPKLIILDNHESHLSISALNYAKENGIILLTLPPHCSHKLQPLDVSVFGPFKKFYNAACDKWMINHPGRPITIYDVGGLIGEAFPQAFTPKNICSGFKATGIEPFDHQIFSEDDFASAYVTDRINPDKECQGDDFRHLESQVSTQHITTPSTSAANNEECQRKGNKLITPEILRPHPKAVPRKLTNNRRKKGQSLVLTDTPVKEAIEEDTRIREEKKYRPKIDKTKQKQVKKRVLDSSSSEDELPTYEESSDSIEDFSDLEEQHKELQKGDYCIVKVYGKTESSCRHYVARIVELSVDGYEVSYLKRYNGTNKFLVTEEHSYISRKDIFHKLPSPTKSSTSRYENMVIFNADFSEFQFTIF